jgi:hypothetical protein
VSDAGEVLSSGSDRRLPPWVVRTALALAVAVAAAVWLGPTVGSWLRDTTTVPRAGDMPVADGVDALRAAGLRAEVEERFAACWPALWVIDQQPPPGSKVEPGARVRLTVADARSARTVCPGGVATENDRALSARFIAFAQHPGAATDLPWAQRVRILGPDVDVVVPRELADDEATWTTPTGSLLAGATDLGMAWLVQAAEERRCAGPPELDGLRRIAVSDTDPTGAPDRRFDDCRPGAAFSLYVDRDYRIHGVQVIGPVTPR